MMLYLYHATKAGPHESLSKGSGHDIDVVVLSVYHFCKLNVPELWVGMGLNQERHSERSYKLVHE